MSLRNLFRRSTRDTDRANEMQAHLDLAIQHYIDRGMTPDEARREARLRFGNPRAHREGVADMHRLPFFDALTLDLRYAIRVLRRSPAFTLTAVATLAIVIGANSAVFSIADHMLLRPLPYPEPGNLYLVETHTVRNGDRNDSRAADGAAYFALRDRLSSAGVAPYAGGGGKANFSIGDRAESVTQERVGTGFFRVLGTQLAMGREFSADEDRPNGPAAVILSDHLWRRVFGGDPAVLGKTVMLRGEAVPVIGVTRPDFQPLQDVDLWTPLQTSTKGEGANDNYQILLRLGHGVTPERLSAELLSIDSTTLMSASSTADPSVKRWLTFYPLQEDLAGGARDPILMLTAAVGAVLLIACVNIASLLLARGGARRKELATRMALGSGRRLVIRQLMVESLLISLAGGVLGLIVGSVALEALKNLAGATLGDWTHVAIDARVVMWTIGISALTSLVFGLVPAWQASRIDVQRGLADGGSRSVAGGSRHWLRRTLVVSQVALGVVLLVCAGLLIRTFAALNRLDSGVNGAGVITASVSLQDARYTTAAHIDRLFTETIDRLRHTPGVASAAVTLELPYTRLLNFGVKLDGDTEGRIANLSYVTADFTKTLGIRLIEGRDLNDGDRGGTAPVVLVNEAFAKLYSPGRDVVGRFARIANVDRQIVGVVNNTQQKPSFSESGVTSGPITMLPGVFAPAGQMSDAFFTLVHTWFRPVWSVKMQPGASVPTAIRAAISAVDPQLPVLELQTIDQVKSKALAVQRLLMTLVALIATAALLLAAMGLHGLIAHSVNERRREFGIRMALGASRGETIRGVAVSGVSLALIGLVLGGGLSMLATRLVASLLWGVTTADVATYASVMTFLLVVAATSSVVPALKLLRLDPAKALRE